MEIGCWTYRLQRRGFASTHHRLSYSAETDWRRSLARKYKHAEMIAAGMNEIGPEVCTTCHNTESPFVGDDYVFDYDKRKDEGTHEHLPLKLRED